MTDPEHSYPSPASRPMRWCPGCDAMIVAAPHGCTWCDTPMRELGSSMRVTADLQRALEVTTLMHLTVPR